MIQSHHIQLRYKILKARLVNSFDTGISLSQVEDAVKLLKLNLYDGDKQLLVYGYTPDDLLSKVIISIPKVIRDSISNRYKYSYILCSCIIKVFDIIISDVWEGIIFFQFTVCIQSWPLFNYTVYPCT